MTVTSSKTTVIPFKGFDGADLALVIQTRDQSLRNQPLLWIVHGSGGVSSCDDIWAEAALSRGYSVLWVDHYGPRGIFKVNHRVDEKFIMYHFNMAEDIHRGIAALYARRDMLYFVDFERGIDMVGFSSGGSAAMYAVTSQFNHDRIKKIGALYPGLWPLTTDMITAQGDKITIYVGDEDDWTRAEHGKIFQRYQPLTRLIVYPNTKHSFSKPGAGAYYDDIHNISMTPFDVPTDMEELLHCSGRYGAIYKEWQGRQLGASAAYNPESTNAAIDDFLGVST